MEMRYRSIAGMLLAAFLTTGTVQANQSNSFPEVTKSYPTDRVCYNIENSKPPEKPTTTSYCADKDSGKLKEINTELSTAVGIINLHVHLYDQREWHIRERSTLIEKYKHVERLSRNGQEYERQFYAVRFIGDNREKAIRDSKKEIKN